MGLWLGGGWRVPNISPDGKVIFKLVFIEMFEISIVGTGVLDCPKNRFLLADSPEACPYNLKSKNIYTRQGITKYSYIVGATCGRPRAHTVRPYDLKLKNIYTRQGETKYSYRRGGFHIRPLKWCNHFRAHIECAPTTQIPNTPLNPNLKHTFPSGKMHGA